MGIVNATPDSFSDGGAFLDPQRAIAHGRALHRAGAGIVDVGGESTRPGAAEVPAEEERARTEPVVAALAQDGTTVSIDTSKAAVAQAALQAGATYVNDVTALHGDPEMAALVADARATVCLMHMRGTPRTMQADPRYADVVDDVKAFLLDRVEHATRAGIAEDRIHLDPGIGFGKTVEHNLALLGRLGELTSLGFPVLLGVSRKGFLGTLTGRTEPADRTAASLAAAVQAYERGAALFRVHDVAEHVDALTVAAATFRGHGL